MVTRLPLLTFPSVLSMAMGCGALSSNATNDAPASSSASPPSTSSATPIPPGGRSYDGKGFVVHEWGTNTIVVGSDGSLQRGLHHEEEDLPAFVTDRLKATKLGAPVEVKMETPVTYFYSPTPLVAQVSVQFPLGVLTQWFPHAASFYPLLASAPDGTGVRDPVLDPNFPFQSNACVSEYAYARNGLLDWGNVSIGARDEVAVVPDAPLDRYTWGFARQVASNPVSVTTTDSGGTSTDSEKFLFYRGLGNSTLPLTVTSPLSKGPAQIELSYPGGKVPPIGPVFILNVGADGGGFTVHPEGLAPGAKLQDVAPNTSMPLDAFSDALAKAVAAELDKTGLYHDEAVAMVHTWQRQWFRTPGVRVLYLMPQLYTDQQIPLSVSPMPDETVRVMMIRVEVITTDVESVDVQNVMCIDAQLTGPCAKHFVDLGRFAEPRLRRAMALAGDSKAAEQLLTLVSGATTNTPERRTLSATGE